MPSWFEIVYGIALLSFMGGIYDALRGIFRSLKRIEDGLTETQKRGTT